VNIKSKILKLGTLKKRIQGIRSRSKKIVFTNGCFDLVHFGHASYLQEAKNKGHVLIVGLNSDSSVRIIKGKKRPIVKEDHRAYVLASLECVDYVVLFNEETPINLIKALKPDVLVKGADWKGKEVVGADIVKENGGSIKLIKYIPGCSTTNLIKTIKKKCS